MSIEKNHIHINCIMILDIYLLIFNEGGASYMYVLLLFLFFNAIWLLLNPNLRCLIPVFKLFKNKHILQITLLHALLNKPPHLFTIIFRSSWRNSALNFICFVFSGTAHYSQFLRQQQSHFAEVYSPRQNQLLTSQFYAPFVCIHVL